MEVIGNYNSIYYDLTGLIDTNESCVLATVVSVIGSTPQVPGSSALINKNGLVAGTVGGGSVEAQVIRIAQGLLETKQSFYAQFNLNNDITRTNDAICGGSMAVLLDACPEIHSDIFNQMKVSLLKQEHGILITLVNNILPGTVTIKRFWYTGEKKEALIPETVNQASEMLRAKKKGEFRNNEILNPENAENSFIYFETILPPPRLIIAGAGHIGKAVSHFGKLLGFEVIVWDDRAEYANKTNLPDADIIITGKFEEAKENIVISPGSYLVIVTHGHKNDADVLKEYIRSEAAYIGMIGSRRKIALVRENFINSGWISEEEWDKIHTPIGIPIGSKTVQEIAVSIAAQLVLERSKKAYNG